MKPILYAETETTFDSNGLGILADCTSCEVTENRNGSYEAELEYPITGQHYGDIANRSLLMIKPNPTSELQPFRIYEISRPMNGLVTISAEHISYDLSGIPVSPFSATSVNEAFMKLKSNSAVENPFEFWTDKTITANMAVSVPSSIRGLLGGSEGSILDCYGGEYEFDRYTVRLHSSRGENRGVSIRYGKNLTDITQEENCSSVYTGVYPYWTNTDGDIVMLDEKIVYVDGSFSFDRILPVDFSTNWQEAPTQDELRSATKTYIKSNNIGVPSVSLTVSFVQLEQTEEYKDKALLERVSLCDTVNVEFEKLGVSATAKCIKTVYDAIRERYVSITLGDAKSGLSGTVASKLDVDTVKDEVTTDLSFAIDKATNMITGNLGGYVVFHSSTGGDQPDEILIMDTPDINTATKVWRWNKSGLGYSNNGYNGPFGLAMTQDGAIVANYITSGTLSAALIKAGLLSDASGKNYWNMETGEFSLSSTANISDAMNQSNTFNALTNNGSAAGIYLKDGQLYINASYMNTGTLDAANIAVKNLTADGVELSGQFEATNGSYYAKLWAAMIDIRAGGYRRANLNTTGGDVSSSYGVLQLFSGNVGEDGSIPYGARYSSLAPSLLEVGKASSDAYDGRIKCGNIDCADIECANIYNSDIYLSGRLRPNDGQNALYCDWVPVQDMNGTQQWVLAGFTYPVG